MKTGPQKYRQTWCLCSAQGLLILSVTLISSDWLPVQSLASAWLQLRTTAELPKGNGGFSHRRDCVMSKSTHGVCGAGGSRRHRQECFSCFGLSALNRRHFDHCADFHTDSEAMFAYLRRAVGRSVNWHQSEYGRAYHITVCKMSRWNGVHDVSSSACHTVRETNLSVHILYIFKGHKLRACSFQWKCSYSGDGFIWRKTLKREVKSISGEPNQSTVCYQIIALLLLFQSQWLWWWMSTRSVGFSLRQQPGHK